MLQKALNGNRLCCFVIVTHAGEASFPVAGRHRYFTKIPKGLRDVVHDAREGDEIRLFTACLPRRIAVRHELRGLGAYASFDVMAGYSGHDVLMDKCPFHWSNFESDSEERIFRASRRMRPCVPDAAQRASGALLIRDRRELRMWNGPGSAERREERRTASGARICGLMVRDAPLRGAPHHEEERSGRATVIEGHNIFVVMPGLVPGIPIRWARCISKRDHRDKPGDDN
ncbi:hypothetical protein ACSVBT_11725 [Afipia sp. TerB]